MLQKNQEIELLIDGMTAEGSGVGHYDGQAVFVRGTAMGDEIVAHIILAKKNYAVGKISKIVKPSADRIEPDCDVSEKCGGCAFRHISYDAELEIKQQKVVDAFTRIGHLDVPVSRVLGGTTDAYRNKAQFPVANDTRDNSLLIGFYAWNTHRIVPCKSCKLQHPIFEDILNIISNWADENKVPAYDEKTGRGLLRHIYIRRAYKSGEIMVCLVISGDSIPAKDDLITDLLAGVKNIKSIVLNINREDTNVVMGRKCINLLGDGYISDELLGKTFRISPLSFYQVNSEQCEVLYSKAAEFADLKGSETLLDLYCGTGTIGLTMADKVKRLVGVEIVPEAIEDAKKNAEINGVTNAEFYCGDAAKIVKDLEIKPDVILVDPPRKGMAESLIHDIVGMDPKKVVYVSCDPATLARDCAKFTELGYHVVSARPVDMFPRTAHVECVVLMSRVDK